MNKILVITCFLLLVILAGCAEPEIQTRSGVLTAVSAIGNRITLTFSSGAPITVIEDNQEDTAEMVDYLRAWIGESMIIEYYYDSSSRGFELKSVSPFPKR